MGDDNLKKIYVNEVIKNNVSNLETLFDMGITIRNDGRIFIDDKELDNLLDGVIDNFYDMDIIKKLGDVNIYVNVEFELDKSIYEYE